MIISVPLSFIGKFRLLDARSQSPYFPQTFQEPDSRHPEQPLVNIVEHSAVVLDFLQIGRRRIV